MKVVHRSRHHISVLIAPRVRDTQVYNHFELSARSAFLNARNLLIQLNVWLLYKTKVQTHVRQPIRIVVDRWQISKAILSQHAYACRRRGQQVRYTERRRCRTVRILVVVRARVVRNRQDLPCRRRQLWLSIRQRVYTRTGKHPCVFTRKYSVFTLYQTTEIVDTRFILSLYTTLRWLPVHAVVGYRRQVAIQSSPYQYHIYSIDTALRLEINRRIRRHLISPKVVVKPHIVTCFGHRNVVVFHFSTYGQAR